MGRYVKVYRLFLTLILKNPFPGDSYTVSTPSVHISIIFKYIKYQYYYIISTILYYTYHIVNIYILYTVGQKTAPMSDYFVWFIEQWDLIGLTWFLKLVDSQHVLVYHVKFSELLLMSFLHKISIFLKCTNIGAVFWPTVRHCLKMGD